jgi:hypothetical protein
MRLPRVRFTVRGMMVAVTVLATVLAGREYLRIRSERFYDMAVSYQAFSVFPGEGRFYDTAPLETYRLELAHKYFRAAQQPWLPVEDDPPMPTLTPLPIAPGTHRSPFDLDQPPAKNHEPDPPNPRGK